MKKYRINILGRNCTIATDKDEPFMRKIEKEINQHLGSLKASMPHADNLDLCIVCLFFLSEKIDTLEKSIEKTTRLSSDAKKILNLLRKDIIEEIKQQKV